MKSIAVNNDYFGGKMKYLIGNKGNFYKANLHTHTTVSDGRFTPEEIKNLYLEKGYSVVAFTDHNVIVRALR